MWVCSFVGSGSEMGECEESEVDEKDMFEAILQIRVEGVSIYQQYEANSPRKKMFVYACASHQI